MSISIVTATYNSMGDICNLVESLRKQKDSDFVWIVADGGSTDGTVDYLNDINDLHIIITKEQDFGIYDALNRALSFVVSDYYIVAGSDDVFAVNAVEEYKDAIFRSKYADIITMPVQYGNSIMRPVTTKAWFSGQFSYVTAHSIGMAIRRSLHDEVGLYSRRFPIAADQHFILKAVRLGAKVFLGESVVGCHGDCGVSSCDNLGVITEFYRVQVDVGFNLYTQSLLFFARLLKYLLVKR